MPWGRLYKPTSLPSTPAGGPHLLGFFLFVTVHSCTGGRSLAGYTSNWAGEENSWGLTGPVNYGSGRLKQESGGQGGSWLTRERVPGSPPSSATVRANQQSRKGRV